MRWLSSLVTILLVLAATLPLSASADPAPKFSILPIADGPISNPYPRAVRAELHAEMSNYDVLGDRKIVARKRLSAEQLAAIEGTITRRVPDMEAAVAACCDPHHYVRYYDRNGRIVGEIAICFCCGCVRTEPYLRRSRGQELDFNYDALKRLVESLGMPTDIQCYHPQSP